MTRSTGKTTLLHDTITFDVWLDRDGQAIRMTVSDDPSEKFIIAINRERLPAQFKQLLDLLRHRGEGTDTSV
jgi:hypothetical protein